MTYELDYAIYIILLGVLIGIIIWRIAAAAKHQRLVETGINIAYGILEAKKIVQSCTYCGHCGYTNPPSDVYCGRCGAELKAEDRTQVY